MKRFILVAMAAAAMAVASTAEAALAYTFTLCQTGYACQVVAGNGFSGSYGDYTIAGALGVGTESAALSTSSTTNLSVSRNTGTTNTNPLNVYLTITGYNLPVGNNESFDVSLGATGNGLTSAGQLITYQAFYSSSNSSTIPPTGTPSQLASCNLGPAGSQTTSCNSAPGAVGVAGFTTFSIISLTQFFIPLGNTATYGSVGTANVIALNPVPEPGSLVLLGTGLLGLATIARRRLARN